MERGPDLDDLLHPRGSNEIPLVVVSEKKYIKYIPELSSLLKKTCLLQVTHEVKKTASRGAKKKMTSNVQHKQTQPLPNQTKSYVVQCES